MLKNKVDRKIKEGDIIKTLKKIIFIILVLIAVLCGVVYGISLALYDGNVKVCVADLISKVVGGVETKYILIMGVSEDISVELTDTMMLAAYNPDTR